MAKKEEDNYFKKWIQLIKADNIKAVLAEAKGKNIDGKKALECIVVISQLAYNDVRKEIAFTSAPDDVLHLSRFLCSLVTLEPTKNIVRYLTSLYHLIHFFFVKDHLEQMISLFKVIVQFKEKNPNVYRDEGKDLHEHYVSFLHKTLVKMASSENTPGNKSTVSVLLSLTLEMLMMEKVLVNGTLFLQIVFQVCQIASKTYQNIAEYMVNTGLDQFYKVVEISDTDSCLPVVFKIYTVLFVIKFKISGHPSSLIFIDSHLNKVKCKFNEKSLHRECLLVLCNAVKLFMWNCTESSMSKKIEDNNRALKSFKKSSEVACVNSACVFMTSMLLYSHKSSKQSTTVLPKTCLKSFLQMILLLCNVLNDGKLDRPDVIQGFAEMFAFVSNASTRYDVNLLKDCKEIIIQAEMCALELLQEMRASGYHNAQGFTELILVRCANLIHSYHQAAIPEEVISLAKPVCKFICSLPSEELKKKQNEKLTEMCFVVLVSALGTNQLYKVLESLVVWAIISPQNHQKIFKLWGDLKHNAICLDVQDHLEMTVWNIVTEGKVSLETEWMPCQLSEAAIGDLLVQELKVYFANKYLRSKAVIMATDALLALNTDCLTHVKGLVIAMNITSATNTFPDQCVAYYNRSKILITRLRKEKKTIDPVDFNCCMGDLLYAQLRFQLRSLRTECELEMVKLSKAVETPLVTELPENRPDPNDTCDVTARFTSLSLARQRELIENVNSALRHWGFAHSLLKEMESSEYDLQVTLSNLQEAGFLLKLYCDEVIQSNVWGLLYSLATVANNVNMIVSAVGEMCNMNGNVEQEWLESVQEHLKSPQLVNKTKQAYLLNVASYHLHKNEVIKGLELLAAVETSIKDNHIQYTRFLIIIGEYQKLTDWKRYNHIFSCSPSEHFSFHKAISYLLYIAEDQKWGSFSEACQIHWQLLNVSRLLGQGNMLLEQPREARCYLKSLLPVAQKLALSLRTVQLLLLLAWVDLNTGMLDDCVVKLEGLEDMLELCGTSVMYNPSSTVAPRVTGRAVLSKPEYLSHSPCCSCLPCTTPEYRRLVLEAVTLRATFCAAFGSLSDGMYCFELAICIQENMCDSESREVHQSCGRLWLRYADVLARSEKYKEAVTANTKAEDLLCLSQDTYTLQHILEQKFTLQYCLLQLQFLPIHPKIPDQVDTTPSKIHSTYPPKTPLNTIAPGKPPLVSVDKNVIPITPVVGLPVKPFRFFSSGEENTPPKPTSKAKKTTKIPKFVTDTPQSVHKSTKTSNTPFVVFNDDKNVSVLDKKSCTGKKKKNYKSESVETTKKTLFSSDNSTEDLATAVTNVGEEIVRKSNRKTGMLRTYGNTKLNSKTIPKPNFPKEEDGNDDVFKFDKMKKTINNLDDAAEEIEPPKCTTNTKISSGLVSTSKGSKSMGTGNSKIKSFKAKKEDSKDNSDCDLVEGTPPPAKQTISFVKPKRTVRTKKLS